MVRIRFCRNECHPPERHSHQGTVSYLHRCVCININIIPSGTWPKIDDCRLCISLHNRTAHLSHMPPCHMESTLYCSLLHANYVIAPVECNRFSKHKLTRAHLTNRTRGKCHGFLRNIDDDVKQSKQPNNHWKMAE